MRIPEKIFRAYDIRGVYGTDITEDTAYTVGLAFGNMLGRGDALVVRDVRLSGPKLAPAVIDGLIDAGLNVLNGGICTTPGAYFGVKHYGCVGAVVVTASHNPPEWNGFKLVRGDGETISQGAGMEELKHIILSGKSKRAASRGSAEDVELRTAYARFLTKGFSTVKGMRLAVDFSDGAAAIIFPEIASSLGIDVRPLNDNPDGYFRGHPPEPSHENLGPLGEKVVGEECNLGVAFDGDADRAVFVDDRGRILEGDTVLAVLVSQWPVRGTIIYDVNSSRAVREVAESRGFRAIEWKVGRAFILRKMREEKAVLGGEKSNHLYFGELDGVDDAMYAALKMAEIVKTSSSHLSSLVDKIPHYPTLPIKTYDCPDEIKFEVVEAIARRMEEMGYRVSRLDGAKAYTGSGWLLLRASNTMPQVKMSAEADNESELLKLKELGDKLFRDAMLSVGRSGWDTQRG